MNLICFTTLGKRTAFVFVLQGRRQWSCRSPDVEFVNGSRIFAECFWSQNQRFANRNIYKPVHWPVHMTLFLRAILDLQSNSVEIPTPSTVDHLQTIIKLSNTLSDTWCPWVTPRFMFSVLCCVGSTCALVHWRSWLQCHSKDDILPVPPINPSSLFSPWH